MYPILKYLKELEETEAFKSRKVLLSCLLDLGEGKPASPSELQLAYYDKSLWMYRGGTWELIAEASQLKPQNGFLPAYLSHTAPLSIPKGLFTYLPDGIETTIGRWLVNALCIQYPFKGKIPFINGKISAGKIESTMLPLFNDDLPDGITVAMFNQYVKCVRLLMSISGMFIHSATRKNTVAPPGIAEFKQTLLAKYDLSKPHDQSRFNDELIAYDERHLAGDPSLGVLISGKNKNRARIKLYGSFGTEVTFGQGKSTRYVTEGLEQGIPTDDQTFAELYTAMRAASFSRGKLTAIGGVLAVLLAKIGADIFITDQDCGTKQGLVKYIRHNDPTIIGRYLLGGKQPLTPTDIAGLAEQRVTLRSPAYCLESNTHCCRYCAGERLYAIKNGVRLGLQSLSAKVTSVHMAAMHGTAKDTTHLEWDSICF